MQALLFVLALSMDIFVAGMAYGMEKIKIPAPAVLTIALLCSAVLGLSMEAGYLLDSCISESLTKMICFLGMFLIGVAKLLDYSLKLYFRKYKYLFRKMTLSNLHFIVGIYCDPIAADSDKSKSLSVRESIFVALAMSADGLLGGIGAAFFKISVPKTLGMNLVFTIIALLGGCIAGARIARKTTIDLSWISGILFMLLAFSKIV